MTLASILCLATLSDGLRIGATAPEFALTDQNGKVHRLTDYRGKTVVLMFFPKDFTPG